LGLIAAAQGQDKEALEAFVRFEQTSAQSSLLPQVLRAKADILASRHEYPEAIAELEKLLASPAARGKPSVEALSRIGETYLTLDKPDKAVPYFQRIYVMYGKYSPLVAKAYWQSGQAFEKLKLRTEAINTYKEFIGKNQLSSTEEYSKAKERLTALGETL
jgi:tetratricopeptide (TPR) repeat protein